MPEVATLYAPTHRAAPSGAQVLRRCGGVQCPPGTCDHDGTLRRRGTGGGPVAAPAGVRRTLASSGERLGAAERAYFEPRFGHDFSAVRVHTDAAAAASAQAVGARAYTVGNHIAFAAGSYVPGTAEGRRLIAHELAHTLQQAGISPVQSAAALPVGAIDDVAEHEAERVAAAVNAGLRPTVVEARRSPTVRRLGANAGCTDAQADLIHQAIYNARGWLNKAIPKLAVSPLAAATIGALSRNFGPTYGVTTNADLIRGRLVAVRNALGTMPFSCASGPGDAACAAGHCGYATAAGADAAIICSDVTLAPGTDWQFPAGCVLHEAFHAHFSGMTAAHDFYSGWHGRSSSTPGYPGAGIDPLLNADAYTTLVMDLS
jgi:hypothetical protein